jgi:hypothetical protein
MSNGTDFGYLYDWVDTYDYDQVTGDQPRLYDDMEDEERDVVLKQIYDEMVSDVPEENRLPFENWKDDFSHLVPEYSRGMEEFERKKFDTRIENTEQLFDLKTTQAQEQHDLIEKYHGVDDEDDFESLTEMQTRHIKEMEQIDTAIERQTSIAKGKAYAQKRKEVQDKNLLNAMRSSSHKDIVDNINETFWDEMDSLRMKYDANRQKNTSKIDKLLLNANLKIDKSFQKKEHSVDILEAKTETNIKNAALELIQDKLNLLESYDDGLWGMLGDMAANDSFLGPCVGVVPGEGEKCDDNPGSPTYGDIIPDE